jgi:hypothetical protein
MSKVIDPRTWTSYQRLRDEGYSRAEACRRAGLSESAAFRFDKGNPSSTGHRVKAVMEANSLPKVKTGKQLSRDARHALECFKCFRLRYFGRTSTPWQLDASEKIIELLSTTEREYVVISCPPGSGKTTAYSHDLLAWLAARDRTIRVMIGARTENQSRDHTRRLRNTFERTLPDMATSMEISKGLRIDAAATLTQDFGRFKPERQDRWQERSFVIATETDQAGSDKEVSFAAYGSDSAFLGGRYDVIVWDDLVDPKNLGTIEIREKLFKWYEEVAETRLEPGGLLLLIGQRMSPDDIYRWALDQKSLLFDDDGELLPDAEQEDAPGKYHHIIYKAHYEDKCFEGSHRLDAPAWPVGCLLDPKRLSWRFLAPKKANNSESFAMVYQQEDTDPTNALVHKDWIEGGKGANGEHHPGCKDFDRGLNQLPAGLTGRFLHIVTADPSPTRYWSIQSWMYNQTTKQRYLMDHINEAMEAPDFLGWNLQTRQFYGVLEEWWQRSKEQGRPIQFVIVEDAAAQRFLLQYDHVREWQRQRQVRILSHQTNRNKSDAKYGVQMLGPLYRDGLVRLPWGDEAGRQASMKLIRELLRWTPGGNTRDDAVMAHWFLEWQLGTNALFKEPETRVPTRSVPKWLRKTG